MASAGVRCLLLLVWLVLPCAPGRAETSPETGRVTEIVIGDTLVLADGRQVRLVGIDAPKPPLGLPKDVPWRLAEAARAALDELALNRMVTLRFGDAASDRYGRVLAQIYRDDGMWLQ